MEKIMENLERTLSFQFSQKLEEKDLDEVAAAGTSTGSGGYTYYGSHDGNGDVTIDF